MGVSAGPCRRTPGEPGLAPEVKEAVDAVLARDARIEVEIAPIKALLDEGGRHLERRTRLEEEARERGVEVSGLDAMPGWRDRSRALRDTAQVLLGEAEGDAEEMRAGARLADMPRLQGRVREVLDRLESLGLGDDVADFHSVAKAVEARAQLSRDGPGEVFDRRASPRRQFGRLCRAPAFYSDCLESSS